MGFPAQTFAFLAGCKHIADRAAFQVWDENHPAFTRWAAQEIVIEWGNGYQYDSTGRYRLCYNCQKVLLEVLGQFFGIKSRADAIREGSNPPGEEEKKIWGKGVLS